MNKILEHFQLSNNCRFFPNIWGYVGSKVYWIYDYSDNGWDIYTYGVWTKTQGRSIFDEKKKFKRF